jgi:hypothetical protein
MKLVCYLILILAPIAGGFSVAYSEPTPQPPIPFDQVDATDITLISSPSTELISISPVTDKSNHANEGVPGPSDSVGDMEVYGESLVVGKNPTDNDYAEAAKWFSKAAVKGYHVAQLNLGRLYEAGRGLSRIHRLLLDGTAWRQTKAMLLRSIV